MKAEIRSLIGMRGVAAVIIFIYHFGKFRLDPASEVWTVAHGYLAVDLFFMLSGFVIGYVYKDPFSSAPLANYKPFLIKRFARLYPAYIVIAAFYALKIAFGLTGEETFARFNSFDIIGNLLMLVGWGLHIYPLIGVSWASSAELGSYIAAPVLIKYTLQRNAAWWAACVGISTATVYLISASGQGSSGPLDVVQDQLVAPTPARHRGVHPRAGNISDRSISGQAISHRPGRSRGRHPDFDACRFCLYCR